MRSRAGHQRKPPAGRPGRPERLRSRQTDQVRLLSRLFAAVALGVGAIFGHKAEPDAHWSDPPNWIADTDTDASNAGAP
jgi:hypothetical protein